MLGTNNLGLYRNLATIDLPAGLTEIGARWFAGCVHLTSVTVPQTISVIGDEAFYDCERLSKVII